MKTNEEKKLDAAVVEFFESVTKQRFEEEIQGLIFRLNSMTKVICLSENENVALWLDGKWLEELDGNIGFKRCVVKALNLLDRHEYLDHAMAWYEQYGLATWNESVLDDMETYRMEQNERR